jgi:hypothetical protein
MVTGRKDEKQIMQKTSAATISQQEIWKPNGIKDTM